MRDYDFRYRGREVDEQLIILPKIEILERIRKYLRNNKSEAFDVSAKSIDDLVSGAGI